MPRSFADNALDGLTRGDRPRIPAVLSRGQTPVAWVGWSRFLGFLSGGGCEHAFDRVGCRYVTEQPAEQHG